MVRRYRVTLIPGDGIGYEVSEAARRCTDAVASKHGFEIEWDRRLAGEDAVKKLGEPLPRETLESIRRNGVALKGPITTPVGSGFRSVNVGLRQKFDLFANVRPAKSVAGAGSRYKNVDIVVIRENTEDLYAGIEFGAGKRETKKLITLVKRETGDRIRAGSAVSLKVISKFCSERIVKFAFDYAIANGRKKVTAVHKANILKFSDGLFLETAKRVARRYPRIEFEDRRVDNMSMQLVVKPEQYDVLVCPNLYGDILSDLCEGLVGSLGLAPSANIGKGCAVFEPIHGSAPKYAGMNKVNPTGMVLSSAMMLDYIGEKRASRALTKAVLSVIREHRHVTYDLNPKSPVGTSLMADAIISKVEANQ